MATYAGYSYDPNMAASTQPIVPQQPYFRNNGTVDAQRMYNDYIGTPLNNFRDYLSGTGQTPRQPATQNLQQPARFPQYSGPTQQSVPNAYAPARLMRPDVANMRTQQQVYSEAAGYAPQFPAYTGFSGAYPARNTAGVTQSVAQRMIAHRNPQRKVMRLQQQYAGEPAFYGPQQPYGTPGTPLDRPDVNYQLRANAQNELQARNVRSLAGGSASPYRMAQLQGNAAPGLSPLQVQAMGGTQGSYSPGGGFNNTPTQMNSYQTPSTPFSVVRERLTNSGGSGVVPNEGSTVIMPRSRTQVTRTPTGGVSATGAGRKAMTPAQILAFRASRLNNPQNVLPNPQQRLAQRQYQQGLNRQMQQFAQTGVSPMMQGQVIPQQAQQTGQQQQAMPQQPMLNQAQSAYGQIMGQPVQGLNPVTGMPYGTPQRTWAEYFSGQQQGLQSGLNQIDPVTGMPRMQQYRQVRPQQQQNIYGDGSVGMGWQ